MYVCIYIHVYIHVQTYIYMYMYATLRSCASLWKSRSLTFSIYICMHSFAYVCTYIYSLYICTYMDTYIYTRPWGPASHQDDLGLCLFLYTHTYIDMYVYVCKYMYSGIYMCTYIRVLFTYVHTYTNTWIHVFTYLNTWIHIIHMNIYIRTSIYVCVYRKYVHMSYKSSGIYICKCMNSGIFMYVHM